MIRKRQQIFLARRAGNAIKKSLLKLSNLGDSMLMFTQDRMDFRHQFQPILASDESIREQFLKK